MFFHAITSWTYGMEMANMMMQPYIAKAYFGLSSPPAKLAKILISSGAMGSRYQFEDMTAVNIVFLRDPVPLSNPG
jgi:hypothetical protein